MKVLDPFAGYRLACGHPVFHLSLFCGSFFAEKYSLDNPVSQTTQDTFTLLRWAHFLLCIFAASSMYSKIDSAIPEQQARRPAGELTEVEMIEQRMSHRDGVWKIFGRICDTISVFCYQGVIFVVQLNVYNLQLRCNDKGVCELEPPDNTLLGWLYIEIQCFYLYMLSAIVYIIYH